VAAVSDLDPGRPQPFGVSRALVAQRIELGGVDDRGREIRDSRRAQRRDARVGAVGAVGLGTQVVPQVVLEGRPVDEVTLREAAARVALRSVIHDRTEEELTSEARLSEGGGGLTYDGGERRPRGVAAHPEA